MIDQSNPGSEDTETTIRSDSPTVLIDVEYHCERCGEFQTNRRKATLVQFGTGCGKRATPINITAIFINDGSNWRSHTLEK